MVVTRINFILHIFQFHIFQKPYLNILKKQIEYFGTTSNIIYLMNIVIIVMSFFFFYNRNEQDINVLSHLE